MSSPERVSTRAFRSISASRSRITRRSTVHDRQHIREEVGRCFTRRGEIRTEPTEEDIKKYISMKLSKDTQSRTIVQSLREEIFRMIPENISQMYVTNIMTSRQHFYSQIFYWHFPRFLLASLRMNEILAQPTIRRRETLRQVNNGLGMGAYAATLERVMGQDGDKGKLGMGVLMWISRSERPLGAEELCHALAIEEDSTELDPENVPAIGTLLNCCQGLATMDEEGSGVRLVCLALQKYLGGHPDLFGRARPKMAEVCLTYLNFQIINDLPSIQSLGDGTPSRLCVSLLGSPR